ncbi:hypothetical protein Patl1_07038 [Pistacia atlantica]|uniref:Uncharacterized protein n=1 Tax=Pistacia atlantica TaxID=434234 RepID=A0ACC1AH52_9ROSI|nr:hypothetical protein Patl1_07038 [Pistacia atlantica]
MAEIATAAGSKAAEKVTETVLKKARIIVIVDNIWKKLDLKVVGIPFSYDDKGNNNETVKMHDITHFVVASIAKEKRMFNIQDANGSKEVFVKEMYKDSIAICLHHGDIDGLPERWSGDYETSRTLRLKCNEILHLRYGVEILLEKAKYLHLDQLDGVKDILWELDREVSIATGLLQLKELWISSCGLEEIVAKEEVDGVPSLDLSEKLTTSQATEPPSPASLILALFRHKRQDGFNKIHDLESSLASFPIKPLQALK